MFDLKTEESFFWNWAPEILGVLNFLMIWNDLGYWKTLKFTTNKRKESVADVGNFEIAERRIDFGDADQRRKESGINRRTNVTLECL